MRTRLTLECAFFQTAPKRELADNFAEAKRPASRRFLVGWCVPGGNPNSHFLQRALKTKLRDGSAEKCARVPEGF